MVRLLAVRTKSNVKMGRFRSRLQASYVSSHTEELWYNETVCLWMTIYIYIYGAFNKFPNFFVQAIKIDVDTWKFSMLLLGIL